MLFCNLLTIFEYVSEISNFWKFKFWTLLIDSVKNIESNLLDAVDHVGFCDEVYNGRKLMRKKS